MSSLKPVAVVREVVFVPEDLLPSRYRRAFEYVIYPNERACQRCQDLDFCSECRYAPVRVSSLVFHPELPLVGLPWGNRRKINKILRRLKLKRVVDRRARPTLPNQLRFTGRLRPYQRTAVQQWLKRRYGLLLAPARSGKTVMAVYILTRLNLRTLVLAHREDLLIQFEDSLREFTDLDSVERFLGQRLVARSKERAFDEAPIGLATFQYFLKRPDRLAAARQRYGLVIVDECHHVPADCFQKVVQGLAPRYRLGLTATPQRKDQREVLLYDIIGPVTAKASPPTLKATVTVHRTNRTVGRFYHWTTFLSRLARDNVRNKLIVKYVKEDHAAGRSILIVVWRRFHVDRLAKLLEKEGIPFVELHGQVPPLKRAANLDLVRQRKVRVTVATRGVVQEGIDCPAWDTIYWITPSANEHGIYQEVSRIRTPSPNKKPPLVRYFLDNEKAAYSCYQIARKVFRREGFTFADGDVDTTAVGRIWNHVPLANRGVVPVQDD